MRPASAIIATYVYDGFERSTSITYGNGTSSSYSHDNISRLSTQITDLSGTANDLTVDFTYNLANQIISRIRSNNLYSLNGYVNVNRNYAVNSLNQYTSAGSQTISYDAAGNLSGDFRNCLKLLGVSCKKFFSCFRQQTP